VQLTLASDDKQASPIEPTPLSQSAQRGGDADPSLM